MEESGLERKRLRLAPPAAEKGWMPVVGEIVEARAWRRGTRAAQGHRPRAGRAKREGRPSPRRQVNEDDCWWEARVLKLDGKKVSFQLRVSDEKKPATLGSKKLRPCSWLRMANTRAK